MGEQKIDKQQQVKKLQLALKNKKKGRKDTEKAIEDSTIDSHLTSKKIKKVNTQLETLLNEKTGQLKGLFKNMIDAYLIMDLRGNVLKLNDAATELFEYDIEKEKINVTKLIYKEDFEYAMRSFFELKKKGFFKNYEARIITKTKKIKWVQINSSILYDKQNNPVAAQGIIRDITSDRKQTVLFQEQKNQLDIIVDNSTFGIALIEQNKIMKCNRAFYELLNYSENEIIKLTIDRISHPKDLKEFESLIKDMYSGKINKFTVKRKFIQKNGTAVWTRTNVKAVKDSNDIVKYQLIFVEDITAERENGLKELAINDIAKAILGKVNTYDIAWEIVNRIANYLDTNDCIIYLYNSETKSLEQVAAYGKKEKKKQIINKLNIPLGDGIVGNVAITGKAEIINDTSKDKRYIVDDNQRFSEIAVPIISKGKIIGVIDSEHYEKNYYTPKHLETLSSIAKIVSNELENAMILDLKQKTDDKNKLLLEELEKSNLALQEYAHVVSHDLKSPLRSINALVNWLKEDNYDKFDENSINNFNLIESTLENMEQLICDVLDYSSVVSEKTNDELIDLNKIVNSIISDFRTSSKVSIKVFNDLPILKGDKIRFKQLFQNLISNAVKYNDKEKGIVLLDYSNNKTHHKISIKDNGMGIEKRNFNKIFEIFQSLNINKNSSGIGLSIVKKIVDFYKGDIWLESEIGIGTTFYFTIKK